MASSHEFKQRGGTETGFLSASSIRAVAEEWCVRAPEYEGAPLPLILRVRADLQPGSDVSFLSAFPSEAECIYPPCTYLEPRSGYEEPVVLPSGAELSVRVIEAVPRVSRIFQAS